MGRPACRFSMSMRASNTSHQAVSFSGPSVGGRGAGLLEIMALGFQLSRPASSPPQGSATMEQPSGPPCEGHVGLRWAVPHSRGAAQLLGCYRALAL